MAQGKPYRCGLVAAGLCVTAVGLFIMTQERPHVYGAVCALGVIMVCVGSVWSLCQCYPKVILTPGSQEKRLQEEVCAAAGARPPEVLPGFCSSRLLPEATKSHSCPTLHLV